MRVRLVWLLAALVCGTAAAGTKIIKDDTFAGWSCGEFQGAGALFEPLWLTGAGFRDGAVTESSGVTSAALPAGLFTPGVYDFLVINLSDERATLPMRFTVLAGNRTAPTGGGYTAVHLGLLTALALVVARRRRR